MYHICFIDRLQIFRYIMYHIINIKWCIRNFIENFINIVLKKKNYGI